MKSGGGVMAAVGAEGPTRSTQSSCPARECLLPGLLPLGPCVPMGGNPQGQLAVTWEGQ